MRMLVWEDGEWLDPIGVCMKETRPYLDKAIPRRKVLLEGGFPDNPILENIDLT